MSIYKSLFVAVVGCALGFAPALAQPGGLGKENKMGYKPSGLMVSLNYVAAPREFPFLTPGGSWVELGDKFNLTLKDPVTLAVTDKEVRIGRVDTVKPEGGTVDLMVRHEDSIESKYRVRIEKREGKWMWRRHGYRVGTFQGTQIVLIDDNSNGRYDEVGVDAMIVGRSGFAAFSSGIVSIGGKLYAAAIGPSGSSLTLSPFSEATGKIRIIHDEPAKLKAAVIKGSNSSFNAADPVVIPVGQYTISWGVFVSGPKRALIRCGEKAVTVDKDKYNSSVKWGKPYKLEINIARSGAKLDVDYGSLKVSGKEGEEYHGFDPAAMPKVTIRNAKTKKDIKSVTFSRAENLIIDLGAANATEPVEVQVELDSVLGKLTQDWRKME